MILALQVTQESSAHKVQPEVQVSLDHEATLEAADFQVQLVGLVFLDREDPRDRLGYLDQQELQEILVPTASLAKLDPLEILELLELWDFRVPLVKQDK